MYAVEDVMSEKSISISSNSATELAEPICEESRKYRELTADEIKMS